MISNKEHKTWVDAKHEAIEHSYIFGFAWIVNNHDYFKVAVGEVAEEAPRLFLTEFKDGVEQ